MVLRLWVGQPPSENGTWRTATAPASRLGRVSALAPKRNGHTNGTAASVGLKAPVDEMHDGTARASPSAGGIQRLLAPDLFADPQAAANFIGSVLEASTEYSIIGSDINNSSNRSCSIGLSR